MSNTMIAIGGCHVAGYKVGEDLSFVNVVARSTGLDCTHRAANYQIKKATGIREKINTNHPDVVLMQLGNYEFHASLKKLFEKKKNKKNKMPAPGSQVSKINEDASSSVPVMLPLTKEPKAGFLFRNIISPFIWNILTRKNRSYLREIRNIIKENPAATFVVLSPIPCFKTSDYLIRRKAARWFEKLFSSIPNVHFIDLFRYISADKRYFIDPAHLNPTGHRILGKIVSQHIKSSSGRKEKQSVSIAI